MNKNELAKEERTIFIVLAIIIMIAIGVLVTWYFTKDKNEVEDKDTKTKTVDKQKKKDIGQDTSKYTFVPSKKEELLAVNNKEEVVEVNKIEDQYINFNENDNYLYLINEKINFASFSWFDDNFNPITIKDAIIKEIKGYKYEQNENGWNWVYYDASGKYIVYDNSKVTFLEEGTYSVTVTSNEKEYQLIITILTENEMYEEINIAIDNITKELKFLSENNYKQYYSETLWNELDADLINFKNTNINNIALKRDMLIKLCSKYQKLMNSYYNETELSYDNLRDELTIKIDALKVKYPNYAVDAKYSNLKALFDEYANLEYEATSEGINKLNELINKIEEEVLNIENNTDVDNEELNNAIDDLNNLIDQANGFVADDYTTDSYQALQLVLTSINSDNLNNMTVNEINNLKNQLQIAINNLVEKEVIVDNTEYNNALTTLKNKVNELENIEEANYTEESYNNFDTLRTELKNELALLDLENVTSENLELTDINNYISRIDSIIDTLEEVNIII